MARTGPDATLSPVMSRLSTTAKVVRTRPLAKSNHLDQTKSDRILALGELSINDWTHM
jgi:hypothetical protein